MTTNWSSEDVVCELRDVKATAAAIDFSGRFLLLSGRLATSIIDLNNPQVVVKKILRKSRWEVGVAAWNFHYDYRHLIAIGSNQRVDILNFEYNTTDLVDNGHSIKGLTRTVLDLDWNNTDPGLIVTCSVDNYVNIWDYKDLRKPVASLPSVCGASQAKWSKTGKNFLATAHEADCKIWDFRKASTPVEYISAHSSKVNGIDWNPNNANQLATCAQDPYIKVWDITALKKPEVVIPVSAPVWRARFAPFGEALVTTGIPQLHRGDTKLSVWALNDVIAPIHQFSGHTEGVYDFFWRPLRYNEYQLVSWSKDQTLRLWKTDSSIQKQCGAAYLNHTIVLDYHHHDFTENASQRGKENYPSSMASSMFSADGISPPSSAVSPLDKELRSIDIANVTVEDVDLKLRVCAVNVNAGQHLVKLHLSFPLGYPEISIPSFQINTETTLNANAVKQLTHSIKGAFERCLKNQAVSVVAGIRTVIQFLANLSADTSPSPRLEIHPAFISPPTPSPKPAVSPWVNPPPSASRYAAQRTQESPLISAATAKLFGKPGVTTSFQSDTVIPFPRICGACFAGDKLVMWSDAWKLGMSSGGARVMLDRGMSGIFPSELSIRQRQVRRQLKKKGKAERSSIVVYKVDGLLSVHPLLAAGYSNDCMNPTRSFIINADLAEKYERRDLAHVWRLLAVTLSTAQYPG
ncbi:hypothetical protein RvY_08166-2 [Ramazzottius varieornatus]|nr:hypothetical protein RvY_08166-2 [Ramazzottius varieornatus]